MQTLVWRLSLVASYSHSRMRRGSDRINSQNHGPHVHLSTLFSVLPNVAKTQRQRLSRAVRCFLVLRLEGDSVNSARKPPPNPACGRGPRDVLRPRHCGDAGIRRLLAIWPDDHNRPSMAASAPTDWLDAKEIGHLLRVARGHPIDFGYSEVRQCERSSQRQANRTAQQDALDRLTPLGRKFTKPSGQLSRQFVSILPNDVPRRFALALRRHVRGQRRFCGIAQFDDLVRRAIVVMLSASKPTHDLFRHLLRGGSDVVVHASGVQSGLYPMRRKSGLNLDAPMSIFSLGNVGRPPSGSAAGSLSLYWVYRENGRKSAIGLLRLSPVSSCCVGSWLEIPA